MAVSGTGDWPLRSPRANLPQWHRKQLQFGLDGSRSTLLVDLFFGTPAGGSVYNEPIGETVSLSESLASLGVFAPGVAESVSLAESIGNLAIYAPSMTESIAISEVVGTTAVMTSNLNETMSLAEAIVSAMLYTTNLSETLTLSELLTEVLTAATAERPQNTYMLPRKAPPTGRWKGRK
jgi:hypothetical protein